MMEKIEKGHPLSQSTDFVAENIETLKKLFPTIVKEGKIDIKELQALLGEEVETEEEYYHFTWAGKSMARREANKLSTGTLRPDKESSKQWDTTQNLFIEGDNLEVLKLLHKSYANKVKMIYIDPPYNTGKDFVYKDNYNDNLGNYLQITGQLDEEGKKTSTNNESDGRFHSNWLNMMYPRLKMAKKFLRDDGVIFVSIDKNEYANLIKICDEIFGEENFIGDLIWRKKFGGGQADSNFVTEHEYIAVYQKSGEFNWNDELIEDSLENYNRVDEFGQYKIVKLAKWGNTARRIDRPSMYFALIDPSGENNFPIAPDGSDGRWRVGRDKVDKLLSNNLIQWEQRNGTYVPYEKIYFDSNNFKPNKIRSILYNVAQTGDGTNELTLLFNKKDLFENPKPVELIITFIKNNLTDGEYILDFFAGSGTTAHAVMQLNAEDGGTRRCISVQLPESTKENSEAFKAGYKTISDITKERIRRAGDKIKTEKQSLLVQKTAALEKLQNEVSLIKDQESIDKLSEEIEQLESALQNLDIGFKAFKLDSSNIRAWDGSPEALESNLFSAASNIKEKRAEEDVLYEILLKYGLDLTMPIEEKVIGGKQVFNIGLGALFICLGDNITTAVAEGIGNWKEELQPATTKVIFKDTGFTDVEKTNSMQVLKRFGIEEVNTI